MQIWKMHGVLSVFFLMGFVFTDPSYAIELHVGEDMKFKFGLNFQSWVVLEEDQSPDGEHVATDFLIRRARLYVNGQIYDWLLFNYQLDMDNDGKKRNVDDPVRPQHTEIYLTLVPDSRARLSLGLVKIPFARQNLEGAFGQLLVDKDFIRGKLAADRGEYDFGITLWGSPLSGWIKYYISLMDGKHGGPNEEDKPRLAGRLEIHLLEPDAPTAYEPGGTYLGNKKVLTFGGAYDHVPDAFLIGSSATDYDAWTVDLFSEIPWKDGALTLESAYLVFDHGASKGTSAPVDQGNGYYLQGGYLIPGEWFKGRFQPVMRYSSFNSDNTSAGSDENRFSLGLNYYLRGHNTKVQLDATQFDFESEDSIDPAKQDHWQFILGIQIKT